MRSVEIVDGTQTEVEPTQATVWICPECYDAYDRRPANGQCLSPGHAAVELVATPLRSVDSLEVVPPATDRARRRRKRPQGRRRARSRRRRTTEAA